MGSQHWTFNMYWSILLVTSALIGAFGISLDQSVMRNVTLEDRRIVGPYKEDVKCFKESYDSDTHQIVKPQDYRIVSHFNKYVSGFRDGRADAKCKCFGPRQVWCIRSRRKISENTYMVTLKSFDNKKFLTSDDHDHRKIKNDRGSALAWEEWIAEPKPSVGEDVYCLKSHFGKYLSAQPNGKLEANRDECSFWEHFAIQQIQGPGKCLNKGDGLLWFIIV